MNRTRHNEWARPLLTALALLALGAARTSAAPDPRQLAELHVATTPAGAACEIDGTPRGITPVTVTALTPGEHLVRLTKTGHRELRRTVTLTPGARAALDEPLDVERGLVLIHTVPSGARVSVNGADRGMAPLLLTDLPLGTYRARAEAPGYLARDVDLTLGDRRPQLVRIALPSSTATLVVTSEPPLADVTINGAAQGRTPLTLDRLPPGEHRIAIALAGFAPFETTIHADAGIVSTVNASLAPLPARLRVTSTPTGARVYLDNTLHGDTPLTIESLAPGAYRLRVERPGYTIAGRTITLAQADDRTEEVRLESNSGIVELTTEPAGVSVYLDGSLVGVTHFGTNATDQVSDPLLLQAVTVGTHTLQLTKQGYYGRKKVIDVRKDETVALHEALKRRFIPDYEVVTSAGVDRGVLVRVDPDGTVRLEVRPGVIKRIRAKDIKGGRPLQQQVPPDLEEEAPADAESSPAAPAPH